MRRHLPLLLALILLLAAFAAGCGGESATVGSEGTKAANIPAGKPVKVEQIAATPMNYDNMVVTTEGNYAVGYCSECFLLKDGVNAVRCEVSSTAPLPPKSKLTARMRVTGKIYVVNGSPNIISSKIEYL